MSARRHDILFIAISPNGKIVRKEKKRKEKKRKGKKRKKQSEGVPEA